MVKLIVGITGKIGAGKSTASKMLKELLTKNGLKVAIMDCDQEFKSQVKDDPSYIASHRRCLGIGSNITKEEMIRLMNRLTIKKYVQFIHNVNFHLYPVFYNYVNSDNDVVIIESAYLLDTPLAFQCHQILNINVKRGIREQRTLLRDKDIRTKEATITLFNAQDRLLTQRYKSTLRSKKGIVKTYSQLEESELEHIKAFTFLSQYAQTLMLMIDGV